MTAETRADAEPIPGTVFNARQVRILKRAVIAMGILLVGGFVLVLSAIVYQASRLGESGAPEAARAAAGLPAAEIAVPVGAGTTVSGVTLDGDRMAVQLDGPDGAEIAVIDLASGRMVSRVRLKSR